MKIKISTPVEKNMHQVWEGFNQELFLALNPPFPPVRLLRFDGCMAGDFVALELNFIFFKQVWESEITAQEASNQEIFFVDEGVKLPFFLSYWKHKHIIKKRETEAATIVDDIEFKTGFLLFDLLMFPALWLQFAYRKPIYKKIFSK